MSALEWLRRQARRDREKPKQLATGGLVRAQDAPVIPVGCQMPAARYLPQHLTPAVQIELLDRADIEAASQPSRLSHADIIAELVTQRLREAAPLPREGVLKCGCVARYSKCYCKTNPENA